MREILFRGKTVDKEKWVYGWLIYDFKINYTSQNYEDAPPRNYQILDNNGNRFDVMPETVGQFIGVVDFSGTKLFEGDIVIDDASETDKTKYIVFQNVTSNSSEYTMKQMGAPFLTPMRALWRFKVVGNIFDNSELL